MLSRSILYNARNSAWVSYRPFASSADISRMSRAYCAGGALAAKR